MYVYVLCMCICFTAAGLKVWLEASGKRQKGDATRRGATYMCDYIYICPCMYLHIYIYMYKHICMYNIY